MSYYISISNKAESDLWSIYEHIAYVLLAPDTAKNQVHRILNRINTLDEMPFRFRQFPFEPWNSQNIRFVAVDNYLVIYIIDEDKEEVSVLRIMYSRQDIEAHLTNTD